MNKTFFGPQSYQNIHGFIFLVFYSWDNTLVSYSWVYIPVFIFQVLQSWFIFLDSYFWFYIPGCIFLVYIPGFFPGFRFMCLDSCFYIPGMIFLVCITGIIFLVLWSQLYISGLLYSCIYSCIYVPGVISMVLHPLLHLFFIPVFVFLVYTPEAGGTRLQRLGEPLGRSWGNPAGRSAVTGL